MTRAQHRSLHDVPVDGLLAVLLQVRIGLGEVLAAKEAAVGG